MLSPEALAIGTLLANLNPGNFSEFRLIGDAIGVSKAGATAVFDVYAEAGTGFGGYVDAGQTNANSCPAASRPTAQ